MLAGITAALDQFGNHDAAREIPIALAVVGLVFSYLFIRHIHRHPHPLVNPATFQIPTFRMVMFGGTLSRMIISAVPFILPLMFQLGFSMRATDAGLLVLALFAGNLCIKPATTPILRRFGFRTTMLVNGGVQAATLFACATLTPQTPIPAVLLLLLISGASRSTQFTCLSTLAFADVPQPDMPSANTLFSVSMQLALGLGVAIGALILQAAGAVMGDSGLPTTADFHATFVVMGVLMLLTTFDTIRMHPAAGATVAQRKR